MQIMHCYNDRINDLSHADLQVTVTAANLLIVHIGAKDIRRKYLGS